jgi:hypothetical protein
MHAERTGCRKAGRGPLFAYGGCGVAPGRFADNCLSRGLALLTYAHEAGLPLNCSEACTAAVDNYYAGGLDLLRFLHEHGCPWDHTAVENARRRGATDCLTYLLQHGCPAVA